jgi:putative heme-binding domain-containing protein
MRMRLTQVCPALLAVLVAGSAIAQHETTPDGAQNAGATATGGAAPVGDATRGTAIFESKESKGQCLNCHRVQGVGSRVGPELTEIGAKRAADLERSLLEPDAEVLPPNRSFRVVTKDNRTTTGRLLNRDAFTVLLIDSKDQLLSFETSKLREYAFVPNSTMPSYKDKLNAQELADLVSYLVSLNPKGPDAR